MMRVVTERVSKTIGATAIHEVFLLMSKFQPIEPALGNLPKWLP